MSDLGVFGDATVDGDVGAKDRLYQLFNQMDLGSLAARAWQAYKNGADIDTIVYDSTRTPEFKAKYPAYEALANQGTPVAVGDIIEYIQRGRSLISQYNLPASFGDPLLLQKAMIGGKSTQELQSDIQEGYVRVSQAPPAIRAAYKMLFGVDGDAALAAAALDPDLSLPELSRRAAQAEVRGYGELAGFDFSLPELQQFADYTTDPNQIHQTLSQISGQRSLFTEDVGEVKDLRAENEGVNAALGGTTAADEIERRRLTRAAQTGGTVSPGVTERGVVGLGPTKR